MSSLIKRLAPSKSYLLSVFLVGFLAAFKWFGLFIAAPVAYACSRRRFSMLYIFRYRSYVNFFGLSCPLVSRLAGSLSISKHALRTTFSLKFGSYAS